MAVLEILQYPDERLRQPGSPVDTLDGGVHQLLDDMLETMYHAHGIGLAAPQIGEPLRLTVIDISDQRNEPMVLINPKVVASSGEEEREEGCLSIPGIYETIKRPAEITVHYLDSKGQECEEAHAGLAARVIQHEVDHLDGKLFIDYLSRLKRNRIRKKMEKEKRLQQAV